MRTVSRNNPIATVIKNYMNKKSGKVTDSRNEIQRRFFGLDWKDQKKIMVAFLDSGISDRDWAYSRLLDLWDASFEPQVLKLWETYHEDKCAWHCRMAIGILQMMRLQTFCMRLSRTSLSIGVLLWSCQDAISRGGLK